VHIKKVINYLRGRADNDTRHAGYHCDDYIKSLHSILSCIVLNAEIQPDQSMNGSTDVYAVPLDDIDLAKKALEDYKSFDPCKG
jgi:hypothetical protein